MVSHGARARAVELGFVLYYGELEAVQQVKPAVIRQSLTRVLAEGSQQPQPSGIFVVVCATIDHETSHAMAIFEECALHAVCGVVVRSELGCALGLE